MARASGPRHVLAAILTLAVVLGGCAQAAPTVAPRGSGTEPAMPRIPDEQAPPLVIYFRSEPASLATRSLGQKSASVRTQIHPFNALLASMDDHARPRPELLASLPELHGPSWIVNADGTMETTYALRSGLTWHDGQPLTSGDIVFSWRVYSSPDLSYSKQPPFSAISDVTALDAERFVIRWTMPYPDAHSLSEREREFPPLPEHILGPAFDQMSATGAGAFANQPFWTTQYVGAGPFRLQNWEAGSSIRAVRVATYPLGKPKIPRIEERFSDDQNVVVAHLLAGTAQAATASALPDVPEALNEQWSRSRAGRVFSSPTSWQQLTYQLRPDYASPRAILDPRIRKGIAQSIDKRAISDAVFSGQAVFSDNPIWKGSGWGDALDDSIPTYPFDPRAAEAWLRDAGYTRGPSGFYQRVDEQLAFEVAITESPDSVREILVMADGLRSQGFDVQQRVIPRIEAQNAQVRATFPALQAVGIGLGEQALNALHSSQIPAQANRWLGGNRGGWASAEYDRLLSEFNTTLDRQDRLPLVRQMLRVYADEIPSVGLFFSSTSFAYVNGLTGPAPAAPESDVSWNIQDWDWTPG